MHEEKALEELELANSVVRSLGCLLTLQATDPNANVRSNYHVHIVGAVPNSQRVLFRVSLLNHLHELSLLLRADAARQNNVSFLAQPDEVLPQILMKQDPQQAVPSDNQPVGPP